MPEVQFSMNGWRRQLSENMQELRDMVTSVLDDDYIDKDDLRNVVDELIALSNSVNCLHKSKAVNHFLTYSILATVNRQDHPFHP